MILHENMICIYKMYGCRDVDDACPDLLGLLSKFRNNTLLPSSRQGVLKLITFSLI